ncbi:MAG: hypothetical protein PHN56_02440 [Candidatus Nanoarchaeia archaeon]|nr:hypothetical protein [Candidatus Nanoarchaeia archaeon]
MKGRPIGSIIRNRIAAILNHVDISYGYEVYKIYKEFFGQVHIRTIYYNLKKGIEKEEIILFKIEKELGDYSWGNEVEKIYYAIGPYANIELPVKDLEIIEKIPKNSLKKSIDINWENELKNMTESLKKEIIEYNERYNVLSNQGKKLLKEKINQKYNKLKEYFGSKIKKEKFQELLKDINPPTP